MGGKYPVTIEAGAITRFPYVLMLKVAWINV